MRLNDGSERVCVYFARANSDDLLERGDKNLSVADLPGFRLRRDGLDDRLGHLAFDCNFDLEFGKKAHGVFRAAIDFRMPLLAAVALDLGHPHALHPECRELLANFVQFAWPDDYGAELH